MFHLLHQRGKWDRKSFSSSISNHSTRHHPTINFPRVFSLCVYCLRWKDGSKMAGKLRRKKKPTTREVEKNVYSNFSWVALKFMILEKSQRHKMQIYWQEESTGRIRAITFKDAFFTRDNNVQYDQDNDRSFIFMCRKVRWESFLKRLIVWFTSCRWLMNRQEDKVFYSS